MSLRLKFNLILIVIFLISLSGAAFYDNGYLEKNAINDVRNNSTVNMETALAIRSYTTDEDGRALINRAYKALYVAKQSGRNRVVRAEDDEMVERRGV